MCVCACVCGDHGGLIDAYGTAANDENHAYFQVADQTVTQLLSKKLLTKILDQFDKLSDIKAPDHFVCRATGSCCHRECVTRRRLTVERSLVSIGGQGRSLGDLQHGRASGLVAGGILCAVLEQGRLARGH